MSLNKSLNILFICFVALLVISCVNAANDNPNNSDDISNYQISSDLSNTEIQTMLDNAKEGDQFEFTDREYKNISLVVDKKLNIVSKKNSNIHTSNKIADKARNLGLNNSFGFYFTSNSGGSFLYGLTIISNSDYGIVVDKSDNTTIKNVVIKNGNVGILVKNSNNADIIQNNISKANSNSIHLENVSKSIISKNTISYNGRSGIHASNIYYCNVTNNTVHHNKFNGISLYNKTTGNIIKFNLAYENPNGIYINSQSDFDVVNSNTFTKNRRNTDYELGAFESGNGLLFGADFKTAKEGKSSRLEVKYNVLTHNEGYQAKNNPDLPTFKLGDNWFDSTDDENTFVCPMLLAGIMKMGTISVKNGFGLQMYDTNGEAVTEFGTFDTTVNVNGNQYTAKFVNGKAIIDANLDPDKEYEIEVIIGDKPVKFTYRTSSGDKNDESDSQTSTDGDFGINHHDFIDAMGNDASKGVGNSENGTSSAHFANSEQSGAHGTNASGNFQDSSDNGDSVLTNGNANAGDSSKGEQSEEGKAYEIVPQSKISKEITDTSGIIVLSIVSILGMIIYGYWRKPEIEN
ncbi:hypothetical protein A9505_02790 [Methanobrevibacter sp. A27]|nr:hypothetical protein A9505_02790 [Methanobrevibacter sp. A27]